MNRGRALYNQFIRLKVIFEIILTIVVLKSWWYHEIWGRVIEHRWCDKNIRKSSWFYAKKVDYKSYSSLLDVNGEIPRENLYMAFID